MDKTQEMNKRAEFRALLEDLASDPEQNKIATEEARLSYQHKFEEIYGYPNTESQFRHFYSDIFLVVSGIFENPSSGDNDVLSSNLLAILNGYVPQEGHPDVRASLNKLFDHLSLDLARLNYTNRIVSKYSRHEFELEELHGVVRTLRQEQESARIQVVETREELNQIQTDVKQVTELYGTVESNLKEAKKELQEAQQKLEQTQNNLIDAQSDLDKTKQLIENAQREYIAILGIFSAVVLTFLGGIAFRTSVFENLHQISAYRIVLAIVLIGLVLCNVLYLLFFCIQTLVARPVQKHQTNTIFIVNLVLVAILVVTFVLWENGVIEERNLRIQQKEIVETQIR